MERTSNSVPVYGGDKPYIFISYSHKDSDRVIPLIVAMESLGYRVWFDQGIEAGSEWSNNIANHLRSCAAFVSFVSANSMSSENCLDEIAFAKSNNKPSLMVSLEENVELSGGIRMGMSYDELRSRLPLNKFTEQDLTSIYSHYSWYSGHTYTRMQGMVLRVSHEQYNLPNRVFYYVEVRSVWTGDYS